MSGRKHAQGPPRDVRRRPPNPRHEDNYPHAGKAARAQVCTGCGLVHHAGRWFRGAPPETEVGATLCPACVRLRDGHAAGTLVLDAPFLPHRDEILHLARNEQAAEEPEHPLERLMPVQESDDGRLVIRTTGVHLARRIARKLERRFHRKGTHRYSDGDQELHVRWGDL